jgi:hypothetical protein
MTWALVLTIGSFAGLTIAPNNAHATNVYGYDNWHPGHYLLANTHSNPPKHISNGDYDSILNEVSSDGTNIFRGIQDKYNWEDLEPTKGNYDFDQIIDDLGYMASSNLTGNPKLVVQIQTGGSSDNLIAVPAYLYDSNDPDYSSTYGTGIYTADGKSFSNLVIWNDDIRDRYKQLLYHLRDAITAANLYNKLEMVVMSESAVGGDDAYINSQGVTPTFTYNVYSDAMNDVARFLTIAFNNANNKIVTLQYANGPLSSLYNIVGGLNVSGGAHVGMGGPDLNIAGKWGNTTTNAGEYAYYTNYQNNPLVDAAHTMYQKVPLGIAVQAPDYHHTVNGNEVDYAISDIVDYGITDLSVNYIFWLNDGSHIDNVITYLKAHVTSTNKQGGLNNDGY